MDIVRLRGDDHVETVRNGNRDGQRGKRGAKARGSANDVSPSRDSEDRCDHVNRNQESRFLLRIEPRDRHENRKQAKCFGKSLPAVSTETKWDECQGNQADSARAVLKIGRVKRETEGEHEQAEGSFPHSAPYFQY